MPKIIGSCKTCGVSIEYWPSQVRTYCSHRCKGIARATGVMPSKPKTGRNEPCVECGADVWRQKHQQSRRPFCNKACHDLWQSRSRVIGICAYCGVEYVMKASQKHYGSKFCTRECEGLSRIKRPLDRDHNGKPAAMDHQGYVRVFEPGHPAATRTGWVFEHRLVMEEAVGRVLLHKEHVHHLNHVRDDNRLENLQLLSASAHAKITGAENSLAWKSAIDARQKLAEYEQRFGPL